MGEPLHVLVVEDDPDDIFIIEHMFVKSRKQHYVMHRASNIEDTREITASQQIDICLLDLNLEETEGLDTLNIFRPVIEPAPIVVLTGLDDEQFGAETIKHGAQDFIPKVELTPELLFRTIRFALERANRASG